jgi:beta-phosphoglucomutase-like phosphatase (HAD superfamily)
LVIFDCDGVLVDSGSCLRWNQERLEPEPDTIVWPDL